MADEKDQRKAANTGEEKPKRTRKAAAPEEKPARAKPRAKAGEKEKEPAAPKAPRRRTTRTRMPAQAKKEEAPKAEAAPDEAAEQKAEPKPKPARRPAPKRSAPAPAASRPVVMARAKYVRSSARKGRLVIDHVRGKPIGEARALLRHSPRGVARDLERLLESAIANAENNHDLVGDDLLVKEIYADEGPTLKRYRARAQGRAYRIRKRTSHLTVALTPKE